MKALPASQQAHDAAELRLSPGSTPPSSLPLQLGATSLFRDGLGLRDQSLGQRCSMLDALLGPKSAGSALKQLELRLLPWGVGQAQR